MATKEQLIEQIDQGRQEMEAALAAFDRERYIYPEWTVKELVAHLVGWYDAVIASLHAHAQGDAPATPASRGINHYNAQTVEERSTLPYEHILKEWQLSLEQVKQAILEMPPERFEMLMVFPWGPSGSIEQLVSIFAEHEKEHAADIRNLKGNEA